MGIPKRFIRKSISIEKYMELELPISRVEGKGWLIDSQLVLIAESPNLLLYATVARSEAGYHSSVNYNTPTGGAICAAYNSTPAVGKIEALEMVVRKAMDNYYVTRHCGNRVAMERALESLKRYKYQQLTLF